MNAKETIAEFWRLQDSGDYTQVVHLFAEDALFVDPVYGTFQGRAAIGEFMAKMVQVMTERKMHFTLEALAGAGGEGDDEGAVWAQWIAHGPEGKVEGCGLYKVRNGQLTYYRDYMNGTAEG